MTLAGKRTQRGEHRTGTGGHPTVNPGLPLILSDILSPFFGPRRDFSPAFMRSGNHWTIPPLQNRLTVRSIKIETLCCMVGLLKESQWFWGDMCRAYPQTQTLLLSIHAYVRLKATFKAVLVLKNEVCIPLCLLVFVWPGLGPGIAECENVTRAMCPVRRQLVSGVLCGRPWIPIHHKWTHRGNLCPIVQLMPR